MKPAHSCKSPTKLHRQASKNLCFCDSRRNLLSGLPYDWVIRSSVDLALLLALGPASSRELRPTQAKGSSDGDPHYDHQNHNGHDQRNARHQRRYGSRQTGFDHGEDCVNQNQNFISECLVKLTIDF